jgi:hypothetical protein
MVTRAGDIQGLPVMMARNAFHIGTDEETSDHKPAPQAAFSSYEN